MQKVFNNVAQEKPSKALSGLPWTPLGELTVLPLDPFADGVGGPSWRT